jgi:phosphoribosylamine---glycine ligase
VNVLLVGGGGREHALAWKLAQSPRLTRLVAAPGNPGIERHAECVALSVDDHDALLRLAEKERPDLVVVGPDAPLVAGLADRLGGAGFAVFGPRARAAAIEGSKAFAKALMARHGVPTARFETFDDAGRARRFARELAAPLVVKTDGLAAGKGAIVCATLAEADDAIAACLERREFGVSGARVIIEEFLVGDEVSFFVLVSGRNATPLAAAQDHKAVFDGDRGPNTGGMGSYSPVPGVTEALVDEMVRTIHQPVVDELRHRGTPFHGCLYAGLMLTAHGPRVLEFNVRFGDPETQAVLPRLRSDFLDLVARATEPGGLAGATPQWDERWAVTVVLASGGYPASASKGDVIVGLDAVPDGVEVTYAGTARGPGGALVTAGGRVLNVTGLGDGPAAARDAAYAGADRITFEGRQLRRDIALRAVERTR